jgi:hypothetical protein
MLRAFNLLNCAAYNRFPTPFNPAGNGDLSPGFGRSKNDLARFTGG